MFVGKAGIEVQGWDEATDSVINDSAHLSVWVRHFEIIAVDFLAVNLRCDVYVWWGVRKKGLQHLDGLQERD